MKYKVTVFFETCYQTEVEADSAVNAVDFADAHLSDQAFLNTLILIEDYKECTGIETFAPETGEIASVYL